MAQKSGVGESRQGNGRWVGAGYVVQGTMQQGGRSSCGLHLLHVLSIEQTTCPLVHN